MTPHILVTGASGFIGRNLIDALGEASLATFRTPPVSYRQKSFIIKDINSKTDWSGKLCGIDVVIHSAGLAHASFSDEMYHDVNVLGTLNLARSAADAGVKRFIFLSSIGVNGQLTLPGDKFHHNSEVNPLNSYSSSKCDAEVLLKELSQNTGLEVVIIRPTLVYGSGAPGNFNMLKKLISKTPILPFGLVNNRRDFISINNLIDLIITCIKHPSAPGKTFLASDGKSVSTRDFTDSIANGLGKTIFQLPIPPLLMRWGGRLCGKSMMVEQLLSNLEVDSSYVRDTLGWVPPYTVEQVMLQLADYESSSK